MTARPTLQTLAFYARERFGEDGYPFEESIPTSFDLVFNAYLDREGGRESVSCRAERTILDRLNGRPGFAPVSQSDVALFVRDALTYLQQQLASEREAGSNRLALSHLFWANLVEARGVYGPLRVAACTCGYVMTGRNDEDLYSMVRGHLWGQEEPERHKRAELPEAALRGRLVGDEDLIVETVPLSSALHR